MTRARMVVRASPVPAPGAAGARLAAAAPAAGDHRRLQRLRPSGAPVAAPAARPSAVPAVLRGPGQPLAAALRQEMETRFGTDFAAVRVHTDVAAADSAAEVGARAYTSGNHVVIGAGGADRHALAHELAHVVQQRQGPVAGTDHGNGLRVSDPADRDEQAAEARAAEVLRAPLGQHGPAAAGTGAPPAAGQHVVQRIGGSQRKVGVEITEAGRGRGNDLAQVAATPAWTGLAPAAQSALWNPATVALPDRNGTTINWRVAPDATMVPAYFTVGNGAKHEWMKWGSVKLTEDFGDYEWIIRHPDQPQPVTYYRSRLDDVAAARAALRTALGGPGQYVLAMNDDPAPGDVGLFELANIDAASAQITFELTDPGRTKQALLEGMTSGLERRNIPDRATLAPADADVRAVVSTAARRLVRAGLTGADADLLMAYIIGDLCHKVATALPGPGWAAPIAANFKQWRTLFPKSHPVQILYQALKGLPDTDALGRVATALAAERAQVAQDVLNLVARKIGTMRNEWSNFAVPPAPPTPQDQNLLHAVVGTLPLGITVPGAIQAYLDQFQPNFIETEYDRTRAALTDMTMVAQDVVRSTGFAQHPGYSRGFAFEDRAEVATDFPGLATTYDRIKALVARF